jgi:two-component sensor histidine kinase
VHLPHALREAAIAAAGRGDERAARRHFRDALKTAVEHENWYDFAWALFERGRVGRALGWPGAEENLADGRWAFRRIGLDPSPLDEWRIPVLLKEAERPTIALVDRFLGVIEAGRHLVQCERAAEVYETVRQAAIHLLHPQRCAIVSHPPQRHGRSSLVIPLNVRGHTVAWLEAVHDDVDDFFQEEERRVGGYLGVLAGAALENAERFEAVQTLSQSLQRQSDERAVMLSEIHHRVRNNLQVILSLLNLQATHVDDEDAARTFIAMATRVRSMALIHEFVHEASNLGEIRMDGYLRTIVEHLEISLGRPEIEVVCLLDDAALPARVAVPCGLLVNELVTNALRHAFPQGRAGRVEVRLAREDPHFVLRVGDDGVGGELAAPNSLGLQLVRILAAQIGEMRILPSDGTTVEIRMRRS